MKALRVKTERRDATAFQFIVKSDKSTEVSEFTYEVSAN